MRLSLVILILLPIASFSQVKHDYVWVIGDEENAPNSDNGVTVLDFGNGNLDLEEVQYSIKNSFTNGSFSSQEGELLFYTNGCYVNDTSHTIMENGAGLNPGIAYDTGNCPDLGNTVSKGLLTLPLPGDDGRYFYMFHLRLEVGEFPFSIYVGDLFYTLIDMEGNGGLGTVLEKNVPIVSDSLYNNLQAVRHANGEDWWVITSRAHTNHFYKVLFTSEGITDILVQEIGPEPNSLQSGSGAQSCFSPDGTRYAFNYDSSFVYLADFDRETGELSNGQVIVADTISVGVWKSVCFSPSGRFLYFNTTVRLWQYDLEATDIQASMELIAEYDGVLTPNGFPTRFFMPQLAPDCKIYLSSTSGMPYLHVIHSPDEKGTACNFEQRGLDLPAINNFSMPNMPNYRLGTGHPVCDSTIELVTSTVRVERPIQEVKVWPNPASGQVNIGLSAPLRLPAEWVLYDGLGRAVFRGEMARGQTAHVFPLERLPPGLYFWEVRSEGGRLGSGKLILTE